MGEVKRVLTRSHKSAEPIEVGRAGTSDPVSGPACELAMARETEPMADAPSEHASRQLGSGRVGLWREPQSGGALVRSGVLRTGDARLVVHQLRRVLALRRSRIPHGVKSAPKAGERSVAKPKNLVTASTDLGRRMAEATSDRDDEGRSRRSSRRTGKPFTWRRAAVDMACRQEVD